MANDQFSPYLKLFWALSFVLILRSLIAPLYGPDLWWHLAVGREMVAGHQFLLSDIFSHTLLGQPWINFEWLSQLSLYAVHQGFGLFGIFLSKILVSLAILFFLGQTLWECKSRGLFLLLSALSARPERVRKLGEREDSFLLVSPYFLFAQAP